MSKLDALNNMMGSRVTADASKNPKTVGTSSMPSALSIQVGRIKADKNQPRKEFTKEDIDHLAASIKDEGLLQPVAVRYDDQSDSYVIIDGERRWRAAKQAKVSTIPAIVTDSDLSADRIMQLQLVANALRCDLTPLESAKAYKQLQTSWKCTAKELASRLNISQSKLSRSMALLELPAKEQKKIKTGKVGPTVAVQKARVKTSTVKKRKASKPITLKTPQGTVILKPAKGVSVADLLQAAIGAASNREAWARPAKAA